MTSDPRITRLPAGLQPGTPPAATPDKAALRRQLLAARRSLDPATRAAWDRALGEHVLAWWRDVNRPALGVYWPLRDEPDLHHVFGEMTALGGQLLLPVVLERDAPLAFAEWQPGEAMVKDAMGIAIPAALRLQPTPPALLVPCLGYNAQGYRLGYGGGFYDRTLEHAPRPATIGIAYSCLAADFDSDGHDVALDRIITEAG
ncbi:5,10-methenyltetrahydrofolate synthetase [Pseudoduganella lurida]|uniref:5-formyltetrahydrofolate cyclo-ligase n=1 Tax=Pseudoduganella lurida TaxID=1036180 RepID=A0A562R235_9BURK|nr:5-formyltetrahydrofolate cyclo-ligase [Pseudoduganella lurida]TWI63119.1 5,10-methenyltetrahydrofolate synthetase [Pseudoduganella lurida]